MTKQLAPSRSLERRIGSMQIAAALGVSRKTAWERMVAGEFGDVVDIAPEGSSRKILRITERLFEEWLHARMKASA